MNLFGAIGGAGLMAEGANQEQAQENQNALASQQVQTGKYGLEDLQRQQATEAAARAASASAASAGKTPSASLLDMAKVYATTDPIKAQTLINAHNQLENNGFTDITHMALANPSVGPRPDIEERMKQTQMFQDIDPGSVNVDANHNINYTKGGQAAPPINVINSGILTGMLAPMKTEIPAGGMVDIRYPGQSGSTTLSNPSFEATREGAVFQKSGSGATGQPTYAPGQYSLGTIQQDGNNVPVSFDKQTGKAFMLGAGGPKSEVKITEPKNPGDPTYVTTSDGRISILQPGTPGTAGKPAGFFTAGTPGTPATGPSLVPVGGQGSPGAAAPAASAAPVTPPIPGAKQAPDGNWYVPNPNKPGGFLMVNVPAAAPAAAGPAPAGTAAPVASGGGAAPAPVPATKPKPAPAAPAEEPAPARAQNVTQADYANVKAAQAKRKAAAAQAEADEEARVKAANAERVKRRDASFGLPPSMSRGAP